VYFVCAGQLIAGEPPADVGGLYVWHDGALAYIGYLQDANESNLNSPRTSWVVNSATTSRVSPDGRHLLFMTRSDAGFRGRGGFAGYEHADHREYYVYSADTGRLACASCNPSGRAATVDAVTAVKDGAGTSAATTKLSHALSDDGRRVFFSTPEALGADDTNGVSDAYAYDVSSGTVHLLSSGVDPTPSYFIDSSVSGDDAFFVTRERLVGWDVDDNYDLYDARVNGGFPEPAAPAPCTGEGCPGQTGSAPAARSLGSAVFRGAGDSVKRLRRKRRCARRAVLRRVRGKTRCVRRRSHRHGRRASASATGRDERSGR
jgi:hypothetical protein